MQQWIVTLVYRLCFVNLRITDRT